MFGGSKLALQQCTHKSQLGTVLVLVERNELPKINYFEKDRVSTCARKKNANVERKEMEIYREC